MQKRNEVLVALSLDEVYYLYGLVAINKGPATLRAKFCQAEARFETIKVLGNLEGEDAAEPS